MTGGKVDLLQSDEFLQRAKQKKKSISPAHVGQLLGSGGSWD